MISKVKFQEFNDINGLDTINLDKYGDTLTVEEAYKELGYFQGLWSSLVDYKELV